MPFLPECAGSWWNIGQCGSASPRMPGPTMRGSYATPGLVCATHPGSAGLHGGFGSSAVHAEAARSASKKPRKDIRTIVNMPPWLARARATSRNLERVMEIKVDVLVNHPPGEVFSTYRD